jgi:hypothetical protein
MFGSQFSLLEIANKGHFSGPDSGIGHCMHDLKTKFTRRSF